VAGHREKIKIVRGGITPVHLAALGILTGFFAGRLSNYVDMDSAKFRRDWTTFDIFFILPKRNNSSKS
jgi:hypothetical protein